MSDLLRLEGRSVSSVDVAGQSALDGERLPGDPILVTGTQRSGTTLLCRMLTAHRSIYVKNEIPDAREVFASAASPREALRSISDAVEQSPAGSPLGRFLREKGKTRWGLKDPGLTYCLPDVLRLFPRARIVVIVRDGRAVASSYMRTGWGVATNIYTGARRWADEVAIQGRFIAARPDVCHRLRYEDLIADPEDALRRICTFIGERFDERMLHYHESEAFLRRNAANESAFQELDGRLAERWKQELSARQLRVFEAVAWKSLTVNGYDLTGPPGSVPMTVSAYYRLHQAVLGPLYLRSKLRASRRNVKDKPTSGFRAT